MRLTIIVCNFVLQEFLNDLKEIEMQHDSVTSDMYTNDNTKDLKCSIIRRFTSLNFLLHFTV